MASDGGGAGAADPLSGSRREVLFASGILQYTVGNDIESCRSYP